MNILTLVPEKAVARFAPEIVAAVERAQNRAWPASSLGYSRKFLASMDGLGNKLTMNQREEKRVCVREIEEIEFLEAIEVRGAIDNIFGRPLPVIKIPRHLRNDRSAPSISYVAVSALSALGTQLRSLAFAHPQCVLLARIGASYMATAWNSNNLTPVLDDNRRQGVRAGQFLALRFSESGLEQVVRRLLEAGKCVAIAEPTSRARDTTGVVKREVSRIIGRSVKGTAIPAPSAR